jgi:hypothetical protein
MIGNDIVDLRDPEVQPGASHPRFDRRVFSSEERGALRASGARERLRWILWAAKEAAYKVARKRDASCVFSPVRFVVHLDASLAGSVEHDGECYPVRVVEEEELVHAVATDGCAGDPEPELLCRVARLPSPEADASALVREIARRELAPRLGSTPEALQVVRRGRVPVLCLDGQPAGLDLSLSHHGRFVAYACQVPPPEQAGATP